MDDKTDNKSSEFKVASYILYTPYPKTICQYLREQKLEFTVPDVQYNRERLRIYVYTDMTEAQREGLFVMGCSVTHNQKMYLKEAS